MNEKINIAEILKDCPKGMELDCTIYNKVTLINVDDREGIVYPIRVFREDGDTIALTKYGQYTDADFAKCVIFPKGKTTWEGFVPPCQFNDWDVVISDKGDIHLLRTEDSSYCAYRERWNGLPKFDKTLTTKVKVVRHATEEERQKLFDAIKENGYKWNEETKTLEKLIQPKFKVGNKVRHKSNHNVVFTITSIEEDSYVCGAKSAIWFADQDNYELVPNKFDISTLKPFDKVLVRDVDGEEWTPNFYGYKGGEFQCVLNYWCQCIPYEGNEHLLGTIDDCDEYFKNW